MTVHIGELHSDVASTSAPTEAGQEAAGLKVERIEDRLRNASRRRRRLRKRVAAEGFDD